MPGVRHDRPAAPRPLRRSKLLKSVDTLVIMRYTAVLITDVVNVGASRISCTHSLCAGPTFPRIHLISPDYKLRWLTAASLATFLVLCIAVTAYFIYAAPADERGGSEALPPTVPPKTWVIYHDAPIRVTPNVLLCATSGRGTAKLSEALDAYCTHVIYTGPLVHQAFARNRTALDNEGYRVFSGLTRTHERYVSFRWKAASWNEGDVLQTLVAYLRFNRLRGIELVMSSHTDRAKLIRFCENFVQKMKTNASLILRVEKAVQLNKGLFKKLASLPAYLVLETQVVNMPGLQTRRFPKRVPAIRWFAQE
ncbi:hypothetical protein MRX96_021917 [Rhipicephalus microplus]